MLPEASASDEIVRAVGYQNMRHAELGTGSKFQGAAMGAPLRMLAEQRLCFVKFFLKERVRLTTTHCGKETLMEASQRAAAERFWPMPSEADDTVLYSTGPKQAVRDISNNLWSIVRADTDTYGGWESQKEADDKTIGQRMIHRLAQCC